MEQGEVLKLGVVIFICISINQGIDTFTKDKYQKAIHKVEELQKEVITLSHKADSIAMLDEFEDKKVKAELKRIDAEYRLLEEEYEKQQNKNKKYKDGIKDIEKKLDDLNIDISELPDF